jgi:hypothetical protein
MKLSIDTCNVTTGWTMTAPSVVSLNQFDDYIAGFNNSASLMFYFNALDAVRTVTKTITPAIDCSAYEELVFNVFSFRNGKQEYAKAADYTYKIKIDSSHEFYFPVYESFTHVTISLAGITSISQIKITPLFATDDWLVVSDIMIVKEQMPLDLFVGLQEGIGKELTTLYGTGLSVATNYAGLTGDTVLTLTAPNWIDRYSAIYITDGTNHETHSIANRTDTVFTLSDLYDGNALLHNYTAATIYLIFPVEYGKTQTDIVLPSITCWGLAPEDVLRGSKLERIVDSWTVGGTPTDRREGHIHLWNTLIDCEARQAEILAMLGEAVHRFLGKEVMWINGKKHDLYDSVPATEVLPTIAGDIVPKLQFTSSVEVKEELWPRVAVPITTHVNVTANLT